jgi:hypothetical protein
MVRLEVDRKGSMPE